MRHILLCRRLSLICCWLLLPLLALSVSAQADPAVAITFPPPVYDVAGTVAVIGTVNPTGLQSYFLEIAPYTLDAPVGEAAQWLPASLPSAQPVNDAVLAQWNTLTVPDGIYQLRLRAVLTNGASVYAVVAPLRVANTLVRPEGGGMPGVPAVDLPQQPGEPQDEPQGERTADGLSVRPNPVNELPVELGGHVLLFNENSIAAMQSAGMTWVKWQTRFDMNDPTFSLDIARDQISRAHNAGFYVLLGVVGDVNQLRDLGEAYYPVLAEFLGRVAALGPDAIEVWNEPNLDREWPTGRIDPRAYTEMLRQAHAAIKAVDPDIMVITAALAPTGAEGAFGLARVWNDDRYYQGLANAGAAQYADCIGVHYNEGIIAPQQRGGDPRTPDYPTRYFVPMLQRAHFPFRALEIPLCLTEFGYLTAEGYDTPLPGSFGWAAGNTVQEQATWLRDAITIAAELPDIDVALMIVWNVDFDNFARDPMAGYALLRPDGTCPACDSIGSLRSGG